MTALQSPPILPLDRIALLLDIDGTLIEHQPHPDDVEMDEELHDLLVDAEEKLGGAVGFITGRMIDYVDRLFSPISLAMAGIFGLEIRLRPGGDVERVAEPEELTRVADALEKRFAHLEGLYFERKGPVLAVHARAVKHALTEINLAAEEALRELPANYRILPGNAGLEFMPVEALKGSAIKRLMAVEPFAGRTPVFIGDDTSDESGFRHVNEIGGISIRVFPKGETDAHYRLANVAAVRRWLRTVLGQEGSQASRLQA